MDWSNEEYVRLYTRETAADLELSWGALALWRALLCKFDRAGIIPIKNGWASVAKLTRIPSDIVVQVGPELVRDGRIKMIDGAVVAPNFHEAQNASKSDRLRQKESRERRAGEARRAPQVIDNTNACHDSSHAVTPSHTPSQSVTLSFADPDPNLSVAGPLLVPPVPADSTQDPLSEFKTKVDRAKRDLKPRATPYPTDWQPRPEEREKAASLGLNCAAEAEAFRDNHTAKGSRFVDWDAAFRTWIRNGAKFAQDRRGNGKQTPLELQLDRVAQLEAEEAARRNVS